MNFELYIFNHDNHHTVTITILLNCYIYNAIIIIIIIEIKSKTNCKETVIIFWPHSSRFNFQFSELQRSHNRCLIIIILHYFRYRVSLFSYYILFNYCKTIVVLRETKFINMHVKVQTWSFVLVIKRQQKRVVHY